MYVYIYICAYTYMYFSYMYLFIYVYVLGGICKHNCINVCTHTQTQSQALRDVPAFCRGFSVV